MPRSSPPTDPALDPAAPPGPRPRVLALGALAVALLALAVFARTIENGFVHYDDPTYVTENPEVTAGLTGEGVRWAFTASHASNWHPLTWLSHMLDCELFGLQAGGHHATNVVLHALAAALLFLALALMTREVRASLFVAALFAVHPLRVESVAWVAERKDVLSAFFWMLTLFAYALYVRRPGAGRYLAVVAAFALGLLAKSMLVTLPLVLLLVDVWPLGRHGVPAVAWRRLVLEKVPLLALAVAVGVGTVLAQRAGGAVGALDTISLGARLANALVSGVAYLWMTVWPSGLAVFYPHPAVVRAGEAMALTVPAIGAGVLLLALTVLAIEKRRAAPWAVTGWLWYLITLLPVVGILQVGMQARADRYSYLPTVGVYVAAVWGVLHVARAHPTLRRALPAVAGVVLAACALVSWRQIGFWHDSEALFARAVAVTERNYIAMLNLGNALSERGEVDEAAGLYEEALALYPPLVQARIGLASIHNLRGANLEEAGDPDGALAAYREAIRVLPDYVAAHRNAGFLLVQRGDLPAAKHEFEEVLRLAPADADAHNNLGVTLQRLGDPAGAARHYRQALAAGQSSPSTANSLAWILATCPLPTVRNGPEAVRLATACVRQTGEQDPTPLRTLAAAHAAVGDFPAAIAWQTKALALAPPEWKPELEADLARFRNGEALEK